MFCLSKGGKIGGKIRRYKRETFKEEEEAQQKKKTFNYSRKKNVFLASSVESFSFFSLAKQNLKENRNGFHENYLKFN